MKKITKNQGGYILAYVLVVVMVVSIIAVIACTTAVKNHDAQIAALEYTQKKYEAEGAVEVFTAELQLATATAANTISKDVADNAGNENVEEGSTEYIGSVSYVKNAIKNSLDAMLTEICQELRDEYDINDDEYSIEPTGVIGDFKNYTYMDNQTEKVDYERGFYPVDIEFRVKNNAVEIEAKYRLVFLVNVQVLDNPDRIINMISGASVEYTSYNVSPLSEGGAAS